MFMSGIFSLIVMLFSLVLHEISHGWAALMLGDNTAKEQGRLSINPLVHLDIIGSVIVPLFLFLSGSPVLFGWAKPVPVNPYNFRDQKWGILKVSLAGPAANFLIALFFVGLVRLINVPANVLDLWRNIIAINLMWGFFNLVPIPPLDGSSILFSLLPEKLSWVKDFLQKYGLILLVFFMFFGLGFISLLVSAVYSLLLG
ncbi:MAG: site-2 protease family protein [bacterium]|nr:site-2 protease family protein [bacterium]